MRNKFAILIENMESMAAVITVRLPPVWLLLPVRIHILPSLQQCPRERVFRSYVEHLAEAKGRQKDMNLYNMIEEVAPELIAEKRHIFKGVSPNVDFYSGFVYEMLGIPSELYTPLFAIARIAGWSAHRLEELVGCNKIIRPAYKSVMEELE